MLRLAEAAGRANTAHVDLRHKTTWLILPISLTALAVYAAPVGAATPVWRAQPMAAPVATDDYFVDGVSCSAANACTAVGGVHVPGGSVPDTSLVERWDGTSWSIQAAPDPAGATAATLIHVSCPTATACVAAGIDDTPAAGVYAEVWDGSSWHVTPLPLPAGSSGVMVGGIDCVSAVWCKVAGTVLGPNDSAEPFIDTWNGASWSVDTVPMPSAATNGFFSGIDCFSTTACAAVGNFGSPSLGAAGREPALAETWNGKTWHVDSAADPGAQTIPTGVSCPASGTCYAVGHYRTGAGRSASLVEKKSGSLWLNQTAPQPKTGTDHDLLSISCTSTSSCEAVGSSFGGGIATAGYAAAYTGALGGWKVETLPTRDFFQGVACPARTYCVGVGADLDTNAPTSAIRS